MKRFLSSIAFKAILVAVFCSVAFFAYMAISGNFSSGIRLMDTPTVVKEIKKISELSTATYVEDVVIKDTILKSRDVTKLDVSTNFLKGAFTKQESATDKFIFVEIATGRVRAGFDLSKVKDSDISIEEDVLKITLPQAEILDVIMNPSDVKPFYDEKVGEWTDEQLHEAKTKALSSALEKISANAIASGILERAQTTGVDKVTAMFKGFGFSNVIVNVQ